MKGIVIAMTVMATIAIGYSSFATLRAASDDPSNAQCLVTMGSNVGAIDDSMSSGLFYLCAEDAATDEAPADEGKKDEEKKDEPAQGIDRIWNFVMYG